MSRQEGRIWKALQRGEADQNSLSRILKEQIKAFEIQTKTVQNELLRQKEQTNGGRSLVQEKVSLDKLPAYAAQVSLRLCSSCLGLFPSNLPSGGKVWWD